MTVALPTQLNPTEQDALVKQIGLALLRGAPQRWASIVVEYRAIGRYMETVGQVTVQDQEGAADLPVSQDITMLFSRLRAGMYREGRGTWFNARYQLDQPSAYNLEYDRDEPTWIQPPPPPAFADDLRIFPREEENVPEWLARRLAALKPPFRVARIFDGKGPNGRPLVNRPQVVDAERESLLRFLDEAPLALPHRGLDTDHLDDEGRQSVPVAFHTDGNWIWPAAVNYYLRAHGVAPEPELVDHIRRSEFALPEVEEHVRANAAAFLNRGRPPRPVPVNGTAPVEAEVPRLPDPRAVQPKVAAVAVPEPDVANAFANAAVAAPKEEMGPFGTTFDAFSPAPVNLETPPPWSRTPAEVEKPDSPWAPKGEDSAEGPRNGHSHAPEQAPWERTPDASEPEDTAKGMQPVAEKSPLEDTAPWQPEVDETVPTPPIKAETDTPWAPQAAEAPAAAEAPWQRTPEVEEPVESAEPWRQDVPARRSEATQAWQPDARKQDEVSPAWQPVESDKGQTNAPWQQQPTAADSGQPSPPWQPQAPETASANGQAGPSWQDRAADAGVQASPAWQPQVADSDSGQAGAPWQQNPDAGTRQQDEAGPAWQQRTAEDAQVSAPWQQDRAADGGAREAGLAWQQQPAEAASDSGQASASWQQNAGARQQDEAGPAWQQRSAEDGAPWQQDREADAGARQQDEDSASRAGSRQQGDASPAWQQTAATEDAQASAPWQQGRTADAEARQQDEASPTWQQQPAKTDDGQGNAPWQGQAAEAGARQQDEASPAWQQQPAATGDAQGNASWQQDRAVDAGARQQDETGPAWQQQSADTDSDNSQASAPWQTSDTGTRQQEHAADAGTRQQVEASSSWQPQAADATSDNSQAGTSWQQTPDTGTRRQDRAADTGARQQDEANPAWQPQAADATSDNSQAGTSWQQNPDTGTRQHDRADDTSTRQQDEASPGWQPQVADAAQASAPWQQTPDTSARQQDEVSAGWQPQVADAAGDNGQGSASWQQERAGDASVHSQGEVASAWQQGETASAPWDGGARDQGQADQSAAAPWRQDGTADAGEQVAPAWQQDRAGDTGAETWQQPANNDQAAAPWQERATDAGAGQQDEAAPWQSDSAADKPAWQPGGHAEQATAPWQPGPADTAEQAPWQQAEVPEQARAPWQPEPEQDTPWQPQAQESSPTWQQGTSPEQPEQNADATWQPAPEALPVRQPNAPWQAAEQAQPVAPWQPAAEQQKWQDTPEADVAHSAAPQEAGLTRGQAAIAEQAGVDLPAPPREPATKDMRTPPAAALPSQGPAADVVARLRTRLTELGVSPSRYRMGSPSEAAWTMEQTGEGWRVGWFDDRYVAPAVFEDVADASAFLLGKLLLDSGATPAPAVIPQDPGPSTVQASLAELEAERSADLFTPPRRPEPNATVAAPTPVFDDDDDDFTPRRPQQRQLPRKPEPAVRRQEPARQEPARQEPVVHRTEPTGRKQQEWPIQPKPGEPPLTLFRGKQLMELPPGTEIDRYGEPAGNLTYAAGTPFERRSLVPEWVNRPYRAYRVVKPTEALTGVAIPWFDQPGGGVAYLLKRSIGELLDHGHLVEVDDRDAPTLP
ncbi:glycohydrolase toxin TNT-related protein [Actinokineospora terrae]|uniref:TNT domain-containing protein n=1 Tax=Actinokineospora terrae TaxID=155974 RepID=A0A1H9S4N4_9PSEU|nr:glycohydrolase toxin TNT-related protein [Actinokineospora terrae]SER79323.1 Protein of unknown function [Actinokineospora terrae]